MIRVTDNTFLSLYRGAIPRPEPEPTTYLSLWRGAIPIPSRTPRQAWRADAQEIADRNNIPVADLLGRSNFREHAWPRQELMWRMAARGFSFCHIGRLLDRDHTTIIHGVRAYERRMTEGAS